MMDAFKVVRDFEQALCDYTGAKYAVTTSSCTAALMLAVAWHIRQINGTGGIAGITGTGHIRLSEEPIKIEIPKHTYVGVPMSIIHAGGRPTFRDEEWIGKYRLRPLPVWDSARHFTAGCFQVGDDSAAFPQSFNAQHMVCVSFHWSKTLGIQQGGAILHDNPEADEWLRRARFDGRKEGVHPKDDKDLIIGHHCYMSPETAAAGLVRLSHLPAHNDPLPCGPGTDSDYPDLSTLECFK
jgi:dTDP-4-amino-4,6-dideoxygalactose transaminase